MEGVAVCFGGVVDSNIASIVHVFSCAMGCALYGLKLPKGTPAWRVKWPHCPFRVMDFKGQESNEVTNAGHMCYRCSEHRSKHFYAGSEMARQSRSIVGYHPTGPRAPGTSVAQPRDTTYRIARCYEFTIVKPSPK